MKIILVILLVILISCNKENLSDIHERVIENTEYDIYIQDVIDSNVYECYIMYSRFHTDFGFITVNKDTVYRYQGNYVVSTLKDKYNEIIFGKGNKNE